MAKIAKNVHGLYLLFQASFLYDNAIERLWHFERVVQESSESEKI